jgi:hypothetical protein
MGNQMILKKLVTLLISILITAFLAEGILRFAGYSHCIYNSNQDDITINRYFLIADKFLGTRNKPNGQYINIQINGNPVVTTNSFGYRTSFSSEINIETPCIVFVGDSTTFCGEVNDFETGPSEIAKLVKNSNKSIEVINSGVRGYNTLQSKRMMELILKKFKNVLMIVYVYCDNDFVENLNPIIYFPIYSPTVWLDKVSGKKVEIEARPQIVPWEEGFASLSIPGICTINKYLCYSKSALLYHSHRIFSNILKNYNKKNNLKILEDGSLGPIGMGTLEWSNQLVWAKRNGAESLLIQLIIEMNSICLNHRVKFMTCRFTVGGDFSDEEYYKQICQKANVKFVELVRKFKENNKYYMAKSSTTPQYDPHYNQQGTRTFADGLFPAIISTIDSH